MRSNRKLSARLVAIGVSSLCLLFVFSDSVWTQQARKPNARIKELQKERLVLLEQAHEAAMKLFQNSRVEYAELLATQRELLEARIACAEKPEDRVKVCDEAIKDGVQSLEITKAHREGARGTLLPVLKAQAYVLEIQIMKEKLASE